MRGGRAGPAGATARRVLAGPRVVAGACVLARISAVDRRVCGSDRRVGDAARVRRGAPGVFERDGGIALDAAVERRHAAVGHRVHARERRRRAARAHHERVARRSRRLSERRVGAISSLTEGRWRSGLRGEFGRTVVEDDWLAAGEYRIAVTTGSAASSSAREPMLGSQRAPKGVSSKRGRCRRNSSQAHPWRVSTRDARTNQQRATRGMAEA